MMNLIRTRRARVILAVLLVLFGTPTAGITAAYAQACEGPCLYEFGYIEWVAGWPYLYSGCTVTYLNGEAAIICRYTSIF
jgi:hypothetical protein